MTPANPKNAPQNRLGADKADIFFEFIHKNRPIHLPDLSTHSPPTLAPHRTNHS